MSEVLESVEKTEEPIRFMGELLNDKPEKGPFKGIIYGSNGMNKSTLGSQMPSPYHMDFDGNIEHLPRKDLMPIGSKYHKKRITSFSDVFPIIDALTNDLNHPFKTLIIDSLTSLNTLCLEKVREEHKDKSLTKYGTEFRFCAAEMAELCKKLDILRQRRKMHILITCQTKTKMVQNPLVEAYDRSELDVNEATARIFMDWVSCILFVHPPVSFTKDEQAKKGIATKSSKDRVMPYNKGELLFYTKGNAAYIAKNIYNLPEKIEMDWNVLSSYIINYFDNNK